jgi:hypothetical protein
MPENNRQPATDTWANRRAEADERRLTKLDSLDAWQQRRQLRIDRLVEFLALAVRMARLSVDPSWWSAHAIWAIQRLELLDYRFPECAMHTPSVSIAA